MKTLLVAVTVLAVSTVQADTIYVDAANCPGPGDGSVGDPYCSIQTAIDNAVDTDEIVVAPGTYFETIDFLGKAITLRSSDGPEVTTIDAGGVLGAGSVVTCDGAEGPDSVLQGFTITGGVAVKGGGMYNDGSSPTVIGCVFSDNFADGGNPFGGGMYNKNGSPTVIDCTFHRNFAFGVPHTGSGGGMYNSNSSPTVIRCTFRGNAATLSFAGGGGGMVNSNSNPIIMNCVFDANVGSLAGAMVNVGSNPTVTNCTFARNLVGGIGNYSSDAVLTNCVLWANDYFQIADNSSSSSTVIYSNVQGGWFGAGSNNIDADPLFVSTSSCCVFHDESGCDDPDCEAAVCDVEPFCCDEFWSFLCVSLALNMCSECPNNYRLQPGSPCIDAGDNTAVPLGITTDLDGNPRVVDDPDTPDCQQAPGTCGDPPVVDMGAFEFQPTCPWDLSGDGAVNVVDLLELLMSFGPCDNPAFCPADFDGDGIIGVMDFLALLQNFGLCPDLVECPWDLDGDGTIGPSDLQEVVENLGPCDDPDNCPWDFNGDGVVNHLDVQALVQSFGLCPSFLDCNGNGIFDDLDIAGGTSADCNGNGVPDECDEDCNGNGVPDECDIAGGTSSDCDGNGVPDECEQDCNGNGVPDECDIADGTSSDCNGNGVPDECDVAGGTSTDCNGNGVPDECEEDCNGNGVPDECDIADGTSSDCNGDGVPDECGDDCNGNGVLDECDIFDGTSTDCNANGVPDECEFVDCNANGISDQCDIADGVSQDCNANGVPDECDIADGTSPDFNGNGIPDECEPAANDTCEDPIVISDGETPFITFGATTDGPPARNCGPAAVPFHNDIWFLYTATCTGIATFSLCNDAGFDTVLAVYFEGSCPPPLTPLACSDNAAGCGLTSEIQQLVVDGFSYLIRVGGREGGGVGILTVSCEP